MDDCLEELIKKKLVSEDATLQCSSKIYENIETVVKACDGIEECADNSDEPWLCTNNDIVVYIVIGIFSFIFIILILMKCHSLKNKPALGPLQQEPGKAKEEMKIILERRNEKIFWMKVLQVLRNQY